MAILKVSIQKSHGAVSLVEQDTIENVSWPIQKSSNFKIFFLIFFTLILCNFLERMQQQTAQNQPKSQILFQENCSPHDLCVMTLPGEEMYSYSFVTSGLSRPWLPF